MTTRTAAALVATLAIGGVATLASPFRAITPGTLASGHERLRDRCFACHQPFAGAARERCVRCHAPATIGLQAVDGRPRPPDRPRKPALAGLHASLGGTECHRCHVEHAGRAPAEGRMRFAHDVLPGGVQRQCVSCHAGERPRNALHESAGAACAACHATARWKPATYDHDRLFRFDANHPPRCAACHEPSSGLREYSCTGCHEHERRRMVAKHREERVQDLDRCARCHRSGNEHETIRGGWDGAGRAGEHEREDD